MRSALRSLGSLALLLLALAAACSRSAPYPSGSAGIGGGPADEKAADYAAAGTPDRMIVKTASLTVQVEDVAAAEVALRKLAESSGGFVVESSQVRGDDGDGPRVNITFRVPAERFDETLAAVEKMARRVLYRSVRGEDVTEEFVDLDARRRNLEASRARLLALLEKATDVAGAVEANKALTEVQGELERIAGKMKYLQRSATLSSVSVELTRDPSLVPQAGWHPLRVAKGGLWALLGFAKWLVNAAIVLAIWSPVWLGIFWLLRAGWRRLTRPKAQKA
jgi:hypothetical protein